MFFSSKIITKFAFFVVLVLFVGLSCDNTFSESSPIQSIDHYFNLKKFFSSETVRLSKGITFVKTVFVNGEEEEKILDTLDLENELKPFSSSDINKPAWSDKYEIDSLLDNNGNLQELRYTTKDKTLKTQFLSIKYQDQSVDEIAIENKSKSSVANILQILSYKPAEGFIIESTQDVSTIDENHFKIQVVFKK